MQSRALPERQNGKKLATRFRAAKFREETSKTQDGNAIVLQRTMRSVAEGCKNFAICHACVANGAGTAKKKFHLCS